VTTNQSITFGVHPSNITSWIIWIASIFLLSYLIHINGIFCEPIDRAAARPIIGGGCIFIYSCSARRISFESDCFYSTVCEHEYMNIHPPPPPQLSRLATYGPANRLSLKINVKSKHKRFALLFLSNSHLNRGARLPTHLAHACKEQPETGDNLLWLIISIKIYNFMLLGVPKHGLIQSIQCVVALQR
jgi:hypothetical protein